MINYKRMKDEIVKILLEMDFHICFLIGENGCGKTDITQELNKIDSSIRVFDNFIGNYNEIPEDGKNIIITYRRDIVEKANPTDSVILIYEDGLYCVCDIESELVVQNMFHNVFFRQVDRQLILQRLLINAVTGVWNEYCEEFLEEYLKGEIRKSDKCILNMINEYKENTIWMN